METAIKREEAFRKDLEALLEKHKAELDITDDGRPYGMHSAILKISMYAEWEDGEQLAEYTEFIY